MGMLSWFVRILIILFVVRLLVTFIRGILQGTATPQPIRRAGKAAERIGGKLVRDPQCGTYVPQERAVKHGRGDRVEFFCSATCRDAWVSAGERPAAARE